ncbi:MAG TPA: hypothetical protein VGA50_04715 [Kiloniellales bacterium]
MRRFTIALFGPLIGAFLLSGCATGGLLGQDSVSREAADRLIPAETVAERGLRACLVTTVVSELMTYRVVWFGGTPDEKAQARAAMETMLAAVTLVRGVPGAPVEPFWFETEMFYVIVGLVHGLEGTVKDQVLETVATALTGRVGGLVSTLRVRAGQAALAAVMVEDIQRFFQAEDKGTAEWLDRGWELCEGRVRTNIAKVQ